MLRRFMVSISRETLNEDCHGGSMVHPTVWDRGSGPKTCRVDSRVIEDVVVLSAPWFSGWILEDGGFWSYYPE